MNIGKLKEIIKDIPEEEIVFVFNNDINDQIIVDKDNIEVISGYYIEKDIELDKMLSEEGFRYSIRSDNFFEGGTFKLILKDAQKNNLEFKYEKGILIGIR